MSGLFDDADVIFSYTRAQAIEDGVLVDLTPVSGLCGFKYPVACTAAVYAALPGGVIAEGRYHVGAGAIGKLLHAVRIAARATGVIDRVEFTHEGETMYALCGPGDTAEPVITIMLEGED